MPNGPTVVAEPDWPLEAYIPGHDLWWQRIGVEREKVRINYVDPFSGQVAQSVEDIKDWSQESLEALAETNTVLGIAAMDFLKSAGKGLGMGVLEWAITGTVAAVVVTGVVVVSLGVVYAGYKTIS